MPIRVTCDECRGAFDAPDEDADGLAPCPTCGAACLVPVPGAPPLLAEVIEPDPAPPESPARALAALRAARNEWVGFGRGCAHLKWAAVLGSVGLLAGLALVGFVLALGPPKRAEPQWRDARVAPQQFEPPVAPVRAALTYGLATATALALAASGFLGAVGRTRISGAPARSGAGTVLGAGAVLAWLRAVCFALAVVLVVGASAAVFADADDRNGGTFAFTACVCVALGTVFGSIAELSALPALVAVAAAMPSARLRSAALRTTLVIQLGACAGALVPLALMATAPLTGAPGVEGYGPLAAPLLGATVVFEVVYTLALYALYEAGEGAGATGGDRTTQ